MSRVLGAALPARWSAWQRRKNTLIYLLLRLVATLARALPFGWVRAVAVGLGHLAATVDLSDRRRALANLAAALPELSARQRRRVVRQMFVHLGISAAEMVHVERFMRGPARVTLPDEMRRLLDAALAEGRGVVAVGGHIGNWELCAQVLAAHGYPMTAIAKPLYDPRLTRWVDQQRTAFGQRILWRGDDNVPKELLRVFRHNGILGLLIDQDTRVHGAFVPFFGRPAHTPTAAASLALRHGAPVIALAGHRHGAGHQLRAERLPLPTIGDHDAQTLELTARINAWLEQAIRAAPAQWVWLHDRWRRQPLDLDATATP